MRVCLIGPVTSGKSTLFSAIVRAGGSTVDLSRPDQPHLAVVKVPDPRLDWLAEQYQPEKKTPAELECLDLPGLDLRDEAGRSRGRAHWPAIRQSDGIIFVVRAFQNPAVPAYRDRIDPEGDVTELLGEMLFADLEQVTARIEKLQTAIRKPTPKRDEQQRELALMTRLGEALENEMPILDAIANDLEAKTVRSFGLFTQKPHLAVINCDEGDQQDDAGELAGVPALKLSAQIEEEIAQLEPDEQAEFLADLDLAEPAANRFIRAVYARMNLISFLTVGEDECRAWTIPAGTSAVEAAGKIHSDIARGFIRAETVSYDDFRTAGDMKAAKAAGQVRLEGKEYVVQDGDIINFRFNI
jgi:hypothetical protein